MDVAVYSGSFNPLHIGHLAIIRYMIEEAGFDMVYLIVSPKNPLKDGISSDSGRERYLAAVEAVERRFLHSGLTASGRNDSDGETLTASGRNDSDCRSLTASGRNDNEKSLTVSGRNDSEARVRVDDIELTMPEPHYTIRTLDALRTREPGNAFTLTIGADNLADIRRWRDYVRILKEYGVAVYPRKGFDLTEIKQDLLNEDPAYKIQIIDAPMVDISSTRIREALSNGEDISPFLM